MISHKHKCIFIHIPRCGGTSIENAIVGEDWWKICSGTKHILASTAKREYKDYWDDYFKFAIVRNPWSRMVALSKFPNFYGVSIENEKIDVSNYFKKFPGVEIDPRSYSRGEPIKKISNAVYLNILNEELDFIGKTENLQEDFNIICDKIGIPQQSLPHINKSKHKHYTEYYDEETKQIVAEKYKKDIEYFDYVF